MDNPGKAFWFATAITCLAMGAGGLADLLQVEMVREQLFALGYPLYLATILGVAKLLALVVVAAPGMPVLKEWAYAGITIDLIGAAASHAMAGHGLADVLKPTLVLVFALASYFLRPESRRVGV